MSAFPLVINKSRRLTLRILAVSRNPNLDFVWYKYCVREKVKEKHCKSPCCFMSLCHVVFHQCSAFPSSGFWQTRLSDSSNWGVPHPGSSGFTWNVFPLLHKTSIELGEPAPLHPASPFCPCHSCTSFTLPTTLPLLIFQGVKMASYIWRYPRRWTPPPWSRPSWLRRCQTKENFPVFKLAREASL